MPPGAEWWEIVGLVAALLLVAYRLRLVTLAFRDWSWVVGNAIGNGRRTLATGHRRAQLVRLVADLALFAVIGHTATRPAGAHPGDPGIWIERLGVVVIPVALLLAAVLEARTRAALMHELGHRQGVRA